MIDNCNFIFCEEIKPVCREYDEIRQKEVEILLEKKRLDGAIKEQWVEIGQQIVKRGGDGDNV